MSRDHRFALRILTLHNQQAGMNSQLLSCRKISLAYYFDTLAASLLKGCCQLKIAVLAHLGALFNNRINGVPRGTSPFRGSTYLFINIFRKIWGWPWSGHSIIASLFLVFSQIYSNLKLVEQRLQVQGITSVAEVLVGNRLMSSAGWPSLRLSSPSTLATVWYPACPLSECGGHAWTSINTIDCSC